MYSIEKYLAKLLRDFFINHKGVFSADVSKDIFDYINQNSNINFENLYIKCRREESRFIGFVATKCTPKKIEFEIYINM
jgi:hypothetical protein